VISNEEIEAYILRRGVIWPSITNVRPKYARWQTFLASRGVDSLDPRIQNKVMNLIINQESSVSDSATRHRLRSESGIRPPKP
jgi:hypothetical protein